MYIELKNVSKKIKGIDILDDVSPVSYTHLDVYKRQSGYIWSAFTGKI